jgi:hypothetical protein
MADFGLTSLLSLVGVGTSAVGTIAAGAAQKSASEYQAKQLEIAAAEEQAAAQRDALEKRKERNFLLSRQQARASASGLGALDDTVLDLAGDIVQEGAYQEGLIRYGGGERARGRRAQAASSRLEGRAAMTGSLFSAGGTLMSGLGSLAEDYRANRARSSGYTSTRYG